MNKPELWARISQFCHQCCGNPKDCDPQFLDHFCQLYPYRVKPRGRLRDPETGRLKAEYSTKEIKRAVKAHCKWCLGGNALSVCSSPECSLYPVHVAAIHLRKNIPAKEPVPWIQENDKCEISA
jgi:hypothetical protein